MAGGKDKAQRKHSFEEKKEKVIQICENYALGKTIASCCKGAGIAHRTFREWMLNNEELELIYKEAQRESSELYKQELRDDGRRVLHTKLITGYDYDEEVIEYEKQGRNWVEIKKKKTTKHVPPNAAAVFYALSNTNDITNPDFVNRQVNDSVNKLEIPAIDNLSPEVVEKLIGIIAK